MRNPQHLALSFEKMRYYSRKLAPSTSSLAPNSMDPLLRHRYVAALTAAGMLFVIGTIVVVNRAGITPADNSMAGVNINGVIHDPGNAMAVQNTPSSGSLSPITLPYTNVYSGVSSEPQDAQASNSDAFDWDSFIYSLSKPATQTQNTNQTPTPDAYSFIPSGLITLDKPQSTYTMSASQKALYGWGNDIGSIVKSYEDNHPNQPQILTDHMQDRYNPQKIAAMKALGADLQAVGNSIDSLSPVPPQMQNAAPTLANAYREIGRNLAAIPEAKGDSATVEAILTYNKSAEAFVGKFVAVVLIFQANDVKFGQNEPGSVFMFPTN
jgi:hypothetical protein